MEPAILALDLALCSGAAFDVEGGYDTRTFVLGRPGPKHADDRLVELDRIVTDLVFESGAKTVAIEADTGRGRGSVTLRGYQAVAAAAARRLGCDVVRNICSTQARKLALGYGGGSKEEAAKHAGVLFRLDPALPGDEVDAVILLETTRTYLYGEEVKRAARKAGVMRIKRPPNPRGCP